MNSIGTIILLIGLIIGSLILVSSLNRIQTRNRVINQKVRQIRQRLDDLENIASDVEPLLETLVIPKLINDEVLDLLRSVMQLDPQAEWAQIRLDQATEYANKLSADQRTKNLNRIQHSDSDIAKSKQVLAEAAQILRRHKSVNRLTATEYDGLMEQISWAYTMVEVLSFIAQGHKAVNRKDLMTAYGFYKKAQSFLMRTKLKGQRQHQLVREISEMLSGERLAISAEIMPESEFNPTQKPDFGNTEEGETKQA